MLAELEALRKLMAEFKKNSEDAARRIREYELREQIALNENQTIRDLYKKRVERISQDYIKFIEKRENEFQRFQAYVAYEIDTNVCCNEGLQRVIETRDKEIAGLKETLSIPRQHFKYIEGKTAEQVVKQKDQILKEKSAEMGIPVESLLERMYYNTARKVA